MNGMVVTTRTELRLWAGARLRLRTEAGRRLVLPDAGRWRIARLIYDWSGLEGLWCTRR